MEEVKIDLTISMGDTCSTSMSYEEARELYKALSGIFGGAGSRINQEPAHKKMPETDPMKNIGNSRPQAKPRIVPNTNTKHMTPENQMSASNARVEAARERAAARTSGCGSR